MYHHRISDWDDAYTNGANIAGGDRWPDAWVDPARAYREGRVAAGKAKLDLAYGARPRNRFDLFLPDAEPKGLVVFIHGGYWMRFDQSYWSHLAKGPVDRGYAVAMPTYTLCPETRIAGITKEIGTAIDKIAGMVGGPIQLTGHSAGGHLAARLVCADTPLSKDVLSRLRNVVSISGLHDLRPLMRTALSATLHIDHAEAMAESPLFLEPVDGMRVTCWVGGGERSEFIRQSALLANAWVGVGGATALVEEPDRHHFTIIDGLTDPAHPLTRALLAD
ncbi:alpha/beta hydrolase [Mesorhizobium sp. KR9-304]|uniref:alpha/beta hydrolase n=1 Tax=Mesorhizobium sp. KR9-304 TaxID=3156614 RepID=UPI0032B57971